MPTSPSPPHFWDWPRSSFFEDTPAQIRTTTPELKAYIPGSTFLENNRIEGPEEKRIGHSIL